VNICVATSADWPAIYPFFSQIIDAGETIAYQPGMTSTQAEQVWMSPPPGQTVVARAGDAVLGSAQMGPNRPGRGAHVATASFMVDPDQHGKGVGRALGSYAIDWARSAGFHSMQFNAVVETNLVAVNLWQELGFAIIATVPEAFDHRVHGLVGLHVMYRRL
jgi:GNAT superfamily N-acetyltransferase